MPRKYIVLPAALTVLLLLLTAMFIDVGKEESFLFDFPIISLGTTKLKDDIFQSNNYILPITDVLNLYFRTHCEGNYVSTRNISPRLKNVSCSEPSSDVKFLPAQIIHLQLMNSTVHIRLPDNNFGHQLGEIQNAFKKSYHAELHAALTIYATAICLEGIVLIIAFISFLGTDVAWVFGGFSVLTAILILIGHSIITAFQYQAVTAINQYGKDVGISGYRGTGLLVFIWFTFGVASVASAAWGWGAWMIRRPDDSSETSDDGGVYMNCNKDPARVGIGQPVMLAMRGGKVVRLHDGGISMEHGIDYVRESQIGLAL
ncbi:hypothetical protein BCIN_09g06060 [Botrytis cinerea B05.10]|uniref:Uncharacterized protein n=1 Tax=Botryotinia fuckeliana (strain B05.10) TaxID=332648 RepID=A0A384JTD0_BOTFB|nr:hypothetical protein BCIN_09g06060 [Botrytis cinerea B05.10]ATZ53835.1 hypothetical protein BCIN_09g06060 [Botrytis cinerea B05.10]